MERKVGTISRGVRCPIIREGDDLAGIVVNSVVEAAQAEGFALRDRDVVAITESIVARAQGNYASVDAIAPVSYTHLSLIFCIAQTKLKVMHNIKIGRKCIGGLLTQNILTPREKEVFELLIANYSTREIAKRMGISDKTVRNHISNVMLKLGVKGRAQAVVELLKLGELQL